MDVCLVTRQAHIESLRADVNSYEEVIGLDIYRLLC